MPSSILKPIHDQWASLIKNTGQPRYYATITFRYSLPVPEAKRYCNYLLHLLNQRRKYKQRNEHLKGFAFVEEHATGAPHIHLLIYFSRKFYLASRPSFEEHFYNELKRVKRINRFGELKERIMTGSGTDIQKVYSIPGVVTYVLKTMRNGNSSFIGILSKDGVAWGS
jgi:hypothetical protein